ncbi:MAG: DMT family transporter [Paracoccaceae bacterium]
MSTAPPLPLSSAETLRASFWMAGAIASFTAMAVAGRELSSTLDTFEIMLYRSLVGVAIVTLIAARTGTLAQARTRRFGLHMLRNVTHFTAQNMWFYAITMIPLAQAVALEFTSPLWVVVLAPLLLGERLTPMRALCAALGFIGILIVARPGAGPISWGQLAGAGAALGFALNALITRRLTSTESVTCILIWMTVLQAIFGLLAAGADGDIALPRPGSSIWILVVGTAGLSAHWCLTSALAMAPASVVMPMDFLRLPVIALIGMLLYDEALEWAVVLGAALIIGANWLNLRAERRARV